MKQEDKELLLKDLCGRLPYETTIAYCQNENDWFEEEVGVGIISICINDEYVVKPYLFPLSSMTDEQRKEYFESIRPALLDSIEEADRFEEQDERPVTVVSVKPDVVSVDWLNEHHFDYRGLIEKGLAIDATNLNIYRR